MLFETATNFLLTSLPCSVSSRSCIWPNLAIERRMRRKSECDQPMAPASGGWFLQSGGLSCCSSKSSRTRSTSFSYCCRMSAVLRSISFDDASAVWIDWNLSSSSKADSAERSLTNESSMNCLSMSSMAATFSRSLPMAASHDVW